MKKVLIVLLVAFNFSIVISQTIENSKASSVNAMFNGQSNLSKLIEYIMMRVNYPINSADNCDQGLIIIKFQVTSIGKIDSIEFINELSQPLNLEVYKVLMSTEPLWTPGMQNGIYVKCTFTIPLRFINSSCPGLEYFIKKGNKFYGKQDYQKAFENFASAVRIDPYNSEILQKKIECDKKLNNTFELNKDLKLFGYISSISKKK